MARRRPEDTRQERVANDIHAILARTLRTEVKDPRVAAVSITAVRMSKDLRLAHVNLLPLGGQGDPTELMAGLQAASGFLRRELGKQLHLRHTPELHFHLDEGLDASVAMVSKLAEMHARRAEHGGDGGDEQTPDEASDDEASDDTDTADTDPAS